MTNKVKFVKEIEIKKNKTVWEAAKESKLKIKAPCKGKGKCGKCIVRIVDGKVSQPTKSEKKLLSEKKIKKGYRLACETEIEGDASIALDKEK